jgi:hypothetical protein
MLLGAELARLLDLDLLGLFVKEKSLLGLVALPFIREFNLLGGGWHPLDFDQLSHDLEIAARSAEKAFTEVAKTVPTTCRFEVVQGSMADAIASTSRAGDIVLLFGETAGTVQGESPAFMAILDAAFQSSAAVLLVPDRIARRSGAIVAITTGPKDQSIEAASAIAAAAKEELVVIETFASDNAPRVGKGRLPTGIPYTRTSIPASGDGLVNASVVASALRQMRERLVVMARGDKDVPSMIASIRHVPVLIVGPGMEAAA